MQLPGLQLPPNYPPLTTVGSYKTLQITVNSTVHVIIHTRSCTVQGSQSSTGFSVFFPHPIAQSACLSVTSDTIHFLCLPGFYPSCSRVLLPKHLCHPPQPCTSSAPLCSVETHSPQEEEGVGIWNAVAVLYARPKSVMVLWFSNVSNFSQFIIYQLGTVSTYEMN